MSQRIISRADAMARGLKRYFTGKKCRRGHISERLCANTGCTRCEFLNHRRWSKENPELKRLYQSEYRKNSPKFREWRRNYRLKYRALNEKKLREYARNYMRGNYIINHEIYLSRSREYGFYKRHLGCRPTEVSPDTRAAIKKIVATQVIIEDLQRQANDRCKRSDERHGKGPQKYVGLVGKHAEGKHERPGGQKRDRDGQRHTQRPQGGHRGGPLRRKHRPGGGVHPEA